MQGVHVGRGRRWGGIIDEGCTLGTDETAIRFELACGSRLLKVTRKYAAKG